MIFIGIDAGGTRARCAAVNSCGTFISAAVSNGINFHERGPQASGDALALLVRRAIGELELRDSEVRVAVCMAGLDTAESQQRLEVELRRNEPNWGWVLANDAEAAWAGAFDIGGSGVVAISGTGAVAFARDGDRSARSGGWGASLGDEGSGYDLGRQGLMAVLAAHDRVGRQTSLAPRLLDRLRFTQPTDIIDFAHERARPADIAGLAPLVLAEAEAGDGVAVAIVDRVASSLLEFASSAASEVSPGGRLDFALTGGLSKSQYFSSVVKTRADAPGSKLRWTAPEAPALAGAVRIAMANSSLTSAVRLPRATLNDIEENA